MKKIFLSVLFACSVFYLFAQDENVIQLYIAQKQYEKAKDQVDKWLANPKLKDKDKQTALLWKLNVYSQISLDSSLSAKYPDAAQQAMDAFNQYQTMDPTLKQLKEQNFASGLGNLYSGAFNKGRVAFQSKNWQDAYKDFSMASMLGDLLISNKLSSNNSTVDTITVLYTGYAAQNSQMVDSASKYYSRLADIKVAGPEYEDIYKYLLQYYANKKDDADFKKYLAVAKELYPNDNTVWNQFDMDATTANTDLPALLTKYQQDATAGGMTEDKYIGYAEAFATNDKDKLDKLDSMQKNNLKIAAAQAFGKAFELSDTSGLYAFNAGVIYYSIYGELDDRYTSNRGEGAALKAKRMDIAKEETSYADSASQWLEKAYTVLKAKTDRSRSETTSLNRTVDYLANIYSWQRDETKVVSNGKDYEKYDALYKKYDAEHNTYK